MPTNGEKPPVCSGFSQGRRDLNSGPLVRSGQWRAVSGSCAKWLRYAVSGHRPACPSRVVLGRLGTIRGLPARARPRSCGAPRGQAKRPEGRSGRTSRFAARHPARQPRESAGRAFPPDDRRVPESVPSASGGHRSPRHRPRRCHRRGTRGRAPIALGRSIPDRAPMRGRDGLRSQGHRSPTLG